MYSSSEPDTCGECGFNVTKNGINRSMWLNGAVVRIGQAELFWRNMVVWLDMYCIDFREVT